MVRDRAAILPRGGLDWHHGWRMVGPNPSESVESNHVVLLGGTNVDYLVRRTPRARGLRLTVDPRRGLLVTIPPESRHGWKRPDDRIESFLRERQAWILRHLGRLERERAEVLAGGGLVDGGVIHYRGELHRIRVEASSPDRRRSSVERVGAEAGDELLVRQATRDRRTVEQVLEAWFRARAAEAIDAAVALHAQALGVIAGTVVLRDPRSRWGSASRKGRLMFSWRLVLAPPGALETVVVHELAHLRVFGHGPGFWRFVASRRPDHAAQRAWLRRHSHLLHAGVDSATVPR
jgi:predicted metal-dependent hydrolase